MKLMTGSKLGAMGAKKGKKSQYVIGSVIAIVIIFMWISLPLMNRSSLDSSVPYGSPFSKKSGDLSLLSDGAGMNAPGSLLSGELTDNPATSLDLAASSLFGYLGSGEAEASVSGSGSDSGSGDSGSGAGSSGSGGGHSSYGGPKGKLSVMPSITSGNSNSSTVGSTHNKFFGSGKSEAELVPMGGNLDLKPKNQKAGVLFNSLKNAKDQSLKGATAKEHQEAKNASSTGFDGSQRSTANDLNGSLENDAASAAAGLGSGVDTLLKNNDPKLNSKDNSLPTPTPEEDEEAEESMDDQIKKMIIQMLLQAVIGQTFGAMGQMMAQTIYPNYKPGDH